MSNQIHHLKRLDERIQKIQSEFTYNNPTKCYGHFKATSRLFKSQLKISFSPTVTLTNTQIALQGSESNGYALASSHVAQVFGRDHHPQLKDGELVVKKSWVGKIQELQVDILVVLYDHFIIHPLAKTLIMMINSLELYEHCSTCVLLRKIIIGHV